MLSVHVWRAIFLECHTTDQQSRARINELELQLSGRATTINMPEELFDSYAVLQACTNHTPPECVCDVLDAVVRLIKSRKVSDRTYCHSDEAVEEENTKMREALKTAYQALMEVTDCQGATCCDQDKSVYQICRAAVDIVKAAQEVTT